VADGVYRLAVKRGVAYHSPLPDPPPADLELRLDEGDDGRRRGGQIPNPQQHEAERDEGDVDDGEPDGLGDGRGRQRAHVLALDHDYSWVLANPPVELAVADVDCVDTTHAMLEQAIREAAGRRSDVEGHASRNVDGKRAQGAVELFAAPTDEPRPLADSEGRIRRYVLRRLEGRPIAHTYFAREDHALRLFARPHETAGDEEDVEASLGHLRLPATGLPAKTLRCPSASR